VSVWTGAENLAPTGIRSPVRPARRQSLYGLRYTAHIIHSIYIHKHIIHTYVHAYKHTYLHTYIRAYIHRYIDTYIHTYIHTYTHVP